MKKWVMALLCCCVVLGTSLSYAFLYEFNPITRDEITKLSDKDLTDQYIDISVEVEASNMFHRNSGFTKEGFTQYKSLLRQRLLLSIEVQKRNLEIQKYIKGAEIQSLEE